MNRKYVAFDIEIAKKLPDFGDWKNARPLGITCAATLQADADEPRLWHGITGENQPADRMTQEEAAGLVGYLESVVEDGQTIVTWNGLGFDFDVLAEESGRTESCRKLALDHVDMMFHVFCQMGFPVSLEAAARGMRLPGKLPGISGAEAPGLWAEGKRQEVLDYVAQDVRVTLELASTCQLQRRFSWITRQGKPKRMPLAQGWLSVRDAMKLPEPDTSWMARPLPRRRFTDWLRDE